MIAGRSHSFQNPTIMINKGATIIILILASLLVILNIFITEPDWTFWIRISAMILLIMSMTLELIRRRQKSKNEQSDHE